MNKKLAGVFVPVITPFEDQKVDLAKLAHNIQKSNGTAVAGYMPLGSNGEFVHMSDEEQLVVLKTVKEVAAKGKIIMAGVARQSAYSTVEFGKKVQELGVDFVSVLSPSYFASFMTDMALLKYYTAVAEGVSVPVLLYNCPKFTANVSISADVVKELSAHPNIVGMKDTSSGNIEKYLAVRDKSFEVIAGSVSNFLVGLKAGSSGGVLSMANYLPEACCQVQTLFNEGRVKDAEDLSNKLISLSKRATEKFGVAGVKVGCDLFGYKGGEVRNPLSDCTNEQAEAIKQAFVTEGYL
ncbi:4-hydroxy-tetrahydrodipicolinate synthase [Peptococcaceae bacterium CEB3]|nr:4-hydroxy-tetrahydrodipicolinate synthase [Peptococcaceae bacterium CEB3]